LASRLKNQLHEPNLPKSMPAQSHGMKEIRLVTLNIKNWAESGKYERISINKMCDKLKDWCSKMPNFSYCHRWQR